MSLKKVIEHVFPFLGNFLKHMLKDLYSLEFQCLPNSLTKMITN